MAKEWINNNSLVGCNRGCNMRQQAVSPPFRHSCLLYLTIVKPSDALIQKPGASWCIWDSSQEVFVVTLACGQHQDAAQRLSFLCLQSAPGREESSQLPLGAVDVSNQCQKRSWVMVCNHETFSMFIANLLTFESQLGLYWRQWKRNLHQPPLRHHHHHHPPGVEEPPHTFPTQTNHIGRMRFRVNVDCIMAFNSQPHKRFQNMRLAMTLRVAPCSSEPCKGNKLVHSQVSQFQNGQIGVWGVRLDNLHSREMFETGDSSTSVHIPFRRPLPRLWRKPIGSAVGCSVALQELQADQQAVAHSAPPEQLWEQDTLVTNSWPTWLDSHLRQHAGWDIQKKHVSWHRTVGRIVFKKKRKSGSLAPASDGASVVASSCQVSEIEWIDSLNAASIHR